MRVLATGVFDIIHPGHIFFLESAKKLGDELVVIVSRDRIAKRIKKHTVMPELQRLEVVKALKPVDYAFLGDEENIFKLLPEIRPDVIALGFDQDIDEAWLAEQCYKLGLQTKVVRIRHQLDGDFCSTTKIKQKIKKSKGT
ncbi:MAG: FAD synthase [Candidatus Altiarchaeota archaeon]|nr:FAD synthase [Candidatus Altiarchaeota archaeon]